MLWRTHCLLAVASLWLLSPDPAIWNAATAGPMAASAAFCALLPDLDAGGAKIAHLKIGGIEPLATISLLAHDTFGHRGFMHSALGTVVFGGAAGLVAGHILGWQAGIAAVVGYASHLAGDACTISGIPILYPRKTRIHLMPLGARLSTGTWPEDIVLVALTLAALALFIPLLRQL